MKVRHKGINDLEAIARIDEDVRPAALRRNDALRLGRRFQRADRRRADGDDTAARRLRAADQSCRLLGQLVILAVHLVLFDLFHVHGAKRSESNVERDEADMDSLRLEFGKLLLCEVQTRRRRSRRTFLAAVDRLVALLVLQSLMDVRRQRRFSQAVENLLEYAFIAELHDAPAEIRMRHDLSAKFVGKADNLSHLRLLAGAHQGLPRIPVEAAQQKHLDMRARRLAPAIETCGKDACIVQNQGVAGREKRAQVIEMTVLYRLRRRVEHHESRCVARFDRFLRDSFLRQFVIKILEQHIFRFSSRLNLQLRSRIIMCQNGVILHAIRKPFGAML